MSTMRSHDILKGLQEAFEGEADPAKICRARHTLEPLIPVPTDEQSDELAPLGEGLMRYTHSVLVATIEADARGIELPLMHPVAVGAAVAVGLLFDGLIEYGRALSEERGDDAKVGALVNNAMGSEA